MTIGIDPDDLKHFHNSIDKLFNDLQYYVSSPGMYDILVVKIQKGMRENKLALQNSAGWADVKAKLKHDGKIKYKDPLNVTGQLVDDFYAKRTVANVKDLDNMGIKFTFKDVVRLRPTMHSMFLMSKDPTVAIEYKAESSLKVAYNLEKYTGTVNGVTYNISEAIDKLYNQDMEKLIYAQVAKAFKDNK